MSPVQESRLLLQKILLVDPLEKKKKKLIPAREE